MLIDPEKRHPELHDHELGASWKMRVDLFIRCTGRVAAGRGEGGGRLVAAFVSICSASEKCSGS